jgi:hypothetical protein
VVREPRLGLVVLVAVEAVLLRPLELASLGLLIKVEAVAVEIGVEELAVLAGPASLSSS